MVSIIIPVYNSEATICKCIDSILSQDSENWELLLVDDGSIDESPGICDKYARLNSRIRVFHKNNGGVSSARNLGIEHAQGDYLLFVDSDDYISPECLNIDLSGSADILFFGTNRMLDGKYVGQWSVMVNDKLKGEDNIRSFIKKGLVTEALRAPWGKFIKRSLIGDIRFHDGQKLGEDTLFMLQLVAKANYIETCSQYVYYWIDNACLGAKKYRMSANESTLFFSKIIDAYKKLNVQSEEFERMMFKIFYSVLNHQGDNKVWYSHPLVKEFEEKYLRTERKEFKEMYFLGKNPKISKIYVLLRNFFYKIK